MAPHNGGLLHSGNLCGGRKEGTFVYVILQSQSADQGAHQPERFRIYELPHIQQEPGPEFVTSSLQKKKKKVVVSDS